MIAVVCCGNPNRSDDGAGSHVFRLLRERPAMDGRPDIRLLDAGTDGMAVMFAARGCTGLIVVDACVSESEPGAIFELPGAETAALPAPHLSTHEFRWEHALYAGRKIFRDAFPADVFVFLIEAATVELGTELSLAVKRAAAKLAGRVERLALEKAQACALEARS